MSYSAKDELSSIAVLEESWKEIWRRRGERTVPGINDVSAKSFNDDLKRNLSDIRSRIRVGYRFSGLRGIAIPKSDPAKLRLICIPTLADRVVQKALVKKIEEKSRQLGLRNPSSFGFMRNMDNDKRGVHGAQHNACLIRNKYPWVFKADISRFFDRINRSDLSEKFSKAFTLRSLTPLVLGAIQSEVVTDSEKVKVAIQQNAIKRGVGLRQGMPISPLLSNFVLRDFDQTVAKMHPLVRYADDLLVFAETREMAIQSRNLVENELEKIGHELSLDKSYICSPDEPVDFLGMALAPSKDKDYAFIVSKEQMAIIGQEIKKYHDLDYLIKNKITIFDVLQKLSLIRNGYLSAYASAHNKKDLENRLSQWISGCSNKLYGSLFPREAVEKLTQAQRRFLMLP